LERFTGVRATVCVIESKEEDLLRAEPVVEIDPLSRELPSSKVL
jgi:hypothetical protein